jgi:hypothetical protein
MHETATVSLGERRPTLLRRTLLVAASVTLALTTNTAASHAAPRGDAAEYGKALVVVQDLDENLYVRSTQTVEYDLDEFEERGSGTYPPGQYQVGYRSVRVYVSFGSLHDYYKLSSYLRWKYTKSTSKVSSVTSSWRVDGNDSLSDINDPNNSGTGYYRWKPGISNSGYTLKREWKVTRFALYTYYPRIHIYGRGDGSIQWYNRAR